LLKAANDARGTELQPDGEEADIPEGILDMLIAHPFIGVSVT